MQEGVTYPESAAGFEIRRVKESDGDILEDIYQNNPDTGDISVAPRFRIDPYVGHTEMRPDAPTQGFLAEAPDGDPAGAGFVLLTEARVGGEVRPTAFLSGLAVHPEYRGQGLAKRLAAHRIEYATTNHAEDCVVFATIQTGNEPSRAVADTWADEFMYDTARVQLPPRSDAPDTAPYTVRPLGDDEYPTVVDRINAFYEGAELFAPLTVDQFQTRLEATPIDEPVNRHLVATADGEPVAGASVADGHKLMWQEVVDLPDELADADELPPSIPESREIRPTGVAHLWHAPGHEDAIEVLLETVRARPDSGNRIMVSMDPDGPLGEFVDVDEGAIVLDAAVRGDVDRVEDGFVASLL